MGDTIKYGDKEIVLADKATKTAEQADAELQQLFYILFAVSNPAFVPMLQMLYGVVQEYRHWIYDPTGEHAAPSEMIATEAAKTPGASTDPKHYDA